MDIKQTIPAVQGTSGAAKIPPFKMPEVLHDTFLRTQERERGEPVRKGCWDYYSLNPLVREEIWAFHGNILPLMRGGKKKFGFEKQAHSIPLASRARGRLFFGREQLFANACSMPFVPQPNPGSGKGESSVCPTMKLRTNQPVKRPLQSSRSLETISQLGPAVGEHTGAESHTQESTVLLHPLLFCIGP